MKKLSIFLSILLASATSGTLAEVNPDSLAQSHHTLDEVVVSAQRKYVRSTPRGLKISMIGNPLSEIGSAVEAIKQMPLIDGSEGSISVIGKGNPAIYINGREMQNQTELQLLTSHDIESVEIITNPSAKYGANITAVILIRTKNRQSGVFGSAQASVSASEAWSESAALSGGTHTEKGWTVFGDVSFSDDRFKQSRRYQDRFDMNNTNVYSDTKTSAKNNTKKFTLGAGTDYQSGKNAAGIKYTFSRQPSGIFDSDAHTIFDNGEQTNTISSLTKLSSQNYRHYVNIYGDFSLPSGIKLRIDGDYIIGRGSSDSSTNEEESQREIMNKNQSFYRLLAGKIELTKSFDAVEISVGTDMIRTINNQNFKSNSPEEDNPFSPGSDDVTQTLWSVFSSVDWHISDRWILYGGGRYEVTHTKYDHNDVRDPELSRNYINCLPNIGLNYSGGSVRLSAYYKQNIYRPNYLSLERNYVYVTPTLWSVGNPELQPVRVDELGLNFYYRNFILQANLSRNHDKIGWIYTHDSSLGCNIQGYVNLPNYNSLQIVAVQNLNVKSWHPTFQAILYMQNLSYGNPERNYRKPLYRLSWRNRFDLPWNIYSYLSFTLFGTGNVEVQYCRPTWQGSCILSKNIGNLTLTLQANDIFGTWRQKLETHTNDVYHKQYIKGASQYLELSLRYQFKAAKKKYRGKSVRDDEIGRL